MEQPSTASGTSRAGVPRSASHSQTSQPMALADASSGPSGRRRGRSPAGPGLRGGPCVGRWWRPKGERRRRLPPAAIHRPSGAASHRVQAARLVQLEDLLSLGHVPDAHALAGAEAGQAQAVVADRESAPRVLDRAQLSRGRSRPGRCRLRPRCPDARGGRRGRCRRTPASFPSSLNARQRTSPSKPREDTEVAVRGQVPQVDRLASSRHRPGASRRRVSARASTSLAWLLSRMTGRAGGHVPDPDRGVPPRRVEAVAVRDARPARGCDRCAPRARRTACRW